MTDPDRVPGYSFTAPDGEVISVPPGRVTEAARYTPRSMTRSEAQDIAIAFGLCAGGKVPIRIRAAGAGYEAILPLEFLLEYQDVRAFLEGRRWM